MNTERLRRSVAGLAIPLALFVDRVAPVDQTPPVAPDQSWVNAALLREAQKEVEKGYKEKSNGYTKYGDWYQKTIVNGPKNGDWYQKTHEGNYTYAPWCDMFLAWDAHEAGVEKYAGQFAYTPWHAEWFQKKGALVKTPKPGDIVFYDWQRGKSISGIDHVGIVEKVGQNGKMYTIEGNHNDKLLREVRDQQDVVGYGDPSLVKVG